MEGGGKTYLVTGKNGCIVIGNQTGMSNCVIFSSERIEIGEEVTIGAGTKIYDTDFHSTNPDHRIHGNKDVHSAPVEIGDRAFIGGGVTILKGVHVGKASVIGAGSVVSHDIPDGEIWAGNPAKFIRKLK